MAAVKRSPRRGEVYWVALDPALGSEIRKTRPALVVSNDSCNAHGARVVVVPITSNTTLIGQYLAAKDAKSAKWSNPSHDSELLTATASPILSRRVASPDD